MNYLSVSLIDNETDERRDSRGELHHRRHSFETAIVESLDFLDVFSWGVFGAKCCDGGTNPYNQMKTTNTKLVVI